MNCPNGRTASGTKPRPNKTAACPAKWLGKSLFIENFGVLKCEDTGGAITEGRIDIYVKNYPLAIAFGRQTLGYVEL